MNVEIPVEQFEEFLDKFSEFLERPEKETKTENAGLSRIPSSIDRISNGLERLTDTIKNLAVPTSNVNNEINNIVNNTQETVNTNEVIWEETEQGNSDRIETQSTTHKILREIRDKIMPSGDSGVNVIEGLYDTVSSMFKANKENQLYREKDDAKKNAIAINSVRFLARIARTGEIYNESNKEQNEKIKDSLANLSETLNDTLIDTGREDANREDQNHKRSFFNDLKSLNITRIGFANLENILYSIKSNLTDARTFMAMGLIKTALSDVGVMLGGLMGLLTKIPIIGPLLGAGGRLATSLATHLATLVTGILSRGAITAAFKAAFFNPVTGVIAALGAGLYASFTEELTGLIDEMINIVGDDRLRNAIWQEGVDFSNDVTGKVSDIYGLVTGKFQEVYDTINNFLSGTWFDIESIQVDTKKWLADRAKGTILEPEMQYTDEQYNTDKQKLMDKLATDQNNGILARFDKESNEILDIIKYPLRTLRNSLYEMPDLFTDSFNDKFETFDLFRRGFSNSISESIVDATGGMSDWRHDTIKQLQLEVDKAKQPQAAAPVAMTNQAVSNNTTNNTFQQKPISVSSPTKKVDGL